MKTQTARRIRQIQDRVLQERGYEDIADAYTQTRKALEDLMADLSPDGSRIIEDHLFALMDVRMAMLAIALGDEP